MIPAIVGVGVSIVVQVIKKYFGTQSNVTLALALVLSLVGAFGYSYLQSKGLWDAILPVLTTAGAFYTFIIARFEV